MTENCTQCAYAKKTQLADKDQKPIIGQYQYNCHRFPPSAFMVPTNQGVTIGSAFPVVNESQVCSLFEPRDPATPPQIASSPRLLDG